MLLTHSSLRLSLFYCLDLGWVGLPEHAMEQVQNRAVSQAI